MFEPLEPSVTFGQEDPVYWQLHRFLHWEDVREAIPRRRRRGGDDGDEPAAAGGRSRFPKTTLSKGNNRQRPEKTPSYQQMYLPPPPDYLPVDRRQRLVRQQYADQFQLPKWMYEDLDRRPSPKQGAVHPWDANPPSKTGDEDEPAGIGSKAGEQSTAAEGPNNNNNKSLSNNGGPVVLPPIAQSSKSPSPPKDQHHRRVTLVEPSSTTKAGSPPSPSRANAPHLSSRKMSEGNVGHHGHHVDPKRRNTAVPSDDPNVPEILDALKKRKKPEPGEKGAKASMAKGGEHDETDDHHDENSKKAAVGEAASSSKGNKVDPKKAKAKAQESPKEPKMSARRRILKEFHDKRHPKPKKKYVPNSKKIIKPPKTRERWDHIKAKIGDDFNSNKNWQPSSRRTSIDGDDDHTDLDSLASIASAKRSSSKLSRTNSSKLAPITEQNGPSLNKYGAPLPPILKLSRSSGVGPDPDDHAPGGMRDAAAQAGIFEIAVNTDVEHRNVGISTRDDVVYIYETVEVSRRTKHRHRHRHHRHGHGHGHHRNGQLAPVNQLPAKHKKKKSKSDKKSEKNKKKSRHREKEKRKHRHRHDSESSSSSSVSSRSSSSSASSRSSRSSSSTSRSQSVSSSRTSLVSSQSSLSLRLSPTPPPQKQPSHLLKKAAESKGVDPAELRKQLLGKLNSAPVANISGKKSATPSHSKAPSQRSSRRNSPKVPLSRSSSLASMTTSRRNTDRSTSSQKKNKTPLKATLSNSSVGRKHIPLGESISNSSAVTRSGSAASSVGSTGTVGSSRSKVSARKSSAKSSKPPSASQNRLGKKNSVDPARKRLLSIVQETDIAALNNSLNSSAVKDEPGDGAVLIPCRHCGRKFASTRIDVHESTCQKTQAKTRKVFDSRQRRLSTFADGNDKHLLEQALKPAANKKKPPNKPSSWREKHDAFIEQIRYAKKVTELEKTGGDVRSLGPAPKTFTGDLEACAKCGRKFNSEALKRHAPICKATPIAKK